MIETGFISSIREIWWDVRPHHNFGTVEVRMCDVPGNLEDSLALAALIQCLVKALSDSIDRGTYQHDCHPMMVRQNKWRASRYGLDAVLIDPLTFEPRSTRDIVRWLVDELAPVGAELGCSVWLERAVALSQNQSWADRQLEDTRALRRARRRGSLLHRTIPPDSRTPCAALRAAGLTACIKTRRKFFPLPSSAAWSPSAATCTKTPS